MSTDRPHEELSTWPFPEVKSAFEALQRSVAPAHEHRNTIASVDHLLAYDVSPYPARILLPPTFMSVAEADDITLWDEEIRTFGRIATPNKRLFVCRDTSHMTLYSNLSRLQQLANAGRDWLVSHLIDS